MRLINDGVAVGRGGHQYPDTIETTLYELIETIESEVVPGDDGMIAPILSGLLNDGKAIFTGDHNGLRIQIV